MKHEIVVMLPSAEYLAEVVRGRTNDTLMYPIYLLTKM